MTLFASGFLFMRTGTCSFPRARAAVGTRHGLFSLCVPYSRPQSFLQFSSSLPHLAALATVSQQPRDSTLTTSPPCHSPCAPPASATSHARLDIRPTRPPISSSRVADYPAPIVEAGKMDEGDRSIQKSLAAQDPIVRELLQDEVEHGVLIPLKTTLELRDDYQTGHVLITRTPTKSANPAILYVQASSRMAAAPSPTGCFLADGPSVCFAAYCQMRSLRVILISADAPSHRTCPPTSRRSS